jgi:hypothetical protein
VNYLWVNYIWIALGAIAGASARYFLSLLIARDFPFAFPADFSPKYIPVLTNGQCGTRPNVLETALLSDVIPSL